MRAFTALRRPWLRLRLLQNHRYVRTRQHHDFAGASLRFARLSLSRTHIVL